MRNADAQPVIAEILEHTTVVHGDGKDATTLAEASIRGVGAYLALTNDDEDNLISAILARRLGARTAPPS